MKENIESIRLNLIDAGCDNDFIERFMSMSAEKQKKEMLAMLAGQRSALLDNVHKDERKIYCLDYLITKLKTNNRDEK